MFDRFINKLRNLWASYIDALSGREIPRPLVSRRKANILTILIIVTGLIILFYTQFWWPGLVLVFWAALAVRQYLRNRTADLVLSTFIFVSLFLSLWIQIDWEVLMPVLLSIAAFTIIVRELLMLKPMTPRQKIEEKELELEDDEEHHR